MNPSEEKPEQDSEEGRLKSIRGDIGIGGDSKGESNCENRIRGTDVHDSCGNRRRR